MTIQSKNVIMGALVIAGILTGSALTYYAITQWLKSKDTDEGFSEKGADEPLPKKVLVLGLDGAGKTWFLSALSNKGKPKSDCPTEGFNVVTVQSDKAGSLDTWEIGGSVNVRKYWSKFVEDTKILVFVVDAADRKRFPEAYDEMHKLLGEQRLLEKPILVLANKQDLPDAATASEVKEALGLEDIRHHRIKVIPTGFYTDPAEGVDEVRQLLNNL